MYEHQTNSHGGHASLARTQPTLMVDTPRSQARKVDTQGMRKTIWKSAQFAKLTLTLIGENILNSDSRRKC